MIQPSESSCKVIMTIRLLKTYFSERESFLGFIVSQKLAVNNKQIFLIYKYSPYLAGGHVWNWLVGLDRLQLVQAPVKLLKSLDGTLDMIFIWNMNICRYKVMLDNSGIIQLGILVQCSMISGQLLFWCYGWNLISHILVIPLAL